MTNISETKIDKVVKTEPHIRYHFLANRALYLTLFSNMTTYCAQNAAVDEFLNYAKPGCMWPITLLFVILRGMRIIAPSSKKLLLDLHFLKLVL